VRGVSAYAGVVAVKTLEILVTGRVQNVGFRSCVRRIAMNLAISGKVMNLADGRVQIYATGEPVVLEKFTSMLYSCPVAVIRDLAVHETGYVSFPDFSIQRGIYQYGI